MALKTWDQYVKDADHEPLSLELPGGEVLTITMPTETQLAEFNAAQLSGNGEESLKALLGPKNGAKVIKLGKAAPALTLGGLVKDILDEFGLSLGNSPASSS